ncbi:hypothetical protein GUA87_10800 [Sneathiella sp. P13V-1]|uniref:VOC family protein n=1 Tax=Sneathiella sp. P13V-1 TaxID=2697366 RepID=UPI00187BC321|nr:VOC family protein [Sneathiella sp. P13V-1]MBE7637335.1 hypothetical protein [Sneathiella sp. P13V-1]
MIVPNLMVKDVVKAAAFYRDVIGMKVLYFITKDQQVLNDGDEAGQDIVFTTVELDGQQLMLQRTDSLGEDMPNAKQADQPIFTGTIYFRDHDPKAVQKRATKDQIIREPKLSWYGMNELYLRDTDGYVICVAKAEEEFQM